MSNSAKKRFRDTKRSNPQASMRNVSSSDSMSIAELGRQLSKAGFAVDNNCIKKSDLDEVKAFLADKFDRASYERPSDVASPSVSKLGDREEFSSLASGYSGFAVFIDDKLCGEYNSLAGAKSGARQALAWKRNAFKLEIKEVEVIKEYNKIVAEGNPDWDSLGGDGLPKVNWSN
jgi:hypothetical protein